MYDNINWLFFLICSAGQGRRSHNIKNFNSNTHRKKSGRAGFFFKLFVVLSSYKVTKYHRTLDVVIVYVILFSITQKNTFSHAALYLEEFRSIDDNNAGA